MRFLSISKRRSSTRLRSFSVSCSLCRVSFLRILYFDTPEASSKSKRREFSLSLRMSSIIFNSMMAYESLPIPVSKKRFVMSLSLQFTPLSWYSLSPVRYNLRVMVTSLNSVGRMFLEFSKLRCTSAKWACLRLLVPLNSTFSILSLRSMRDFCSPNTQRMASTTLLFPQPLGPTIPVTPSLKWMVTLSPKLLKPFISIDFNRILLSTIRAKRYTQT